MNDEVENLSLVRQSPWFRRARLMQGFGVAMILVAVGLAAFTNLTDRQAGIYAVAVCGMLGLMSLVPARFILTVYLMSPEQKAKRRRS